MTYTVELAPAAHKSMWKLSKATPKDAARVASLIDSLASNPRPQGVRPLVGRPGVFRVRAGDYRVLYRIEDDRLVVLVLDVGHRREVYDR